MIAYLKCSKAMTSWEFAELDSRTQGLLHFPTKPLYEMVSVSWQALPWWIRAPTHSKAGPSCPFAVGIQELLHYTLPYCPCSIAPNVVCGEWLIVRTAKPQSQCEISRKVPFHRYSISRKSRDWRSEAVFFKSEPSSNHRSEISHPPI